MLRVYYIVYDFIRKRRLKPLKEIYERYYWLVTRLDPFSLSLPENEELPSYLKSFVPVYFKSLKGEAEHHGYSMPFQECTAEELLQGHTDEKCLKSFYEWAFRLFSEHVKKGMPCLHIKGDEIPILQIEDLVSLYKKEGLESHTTAYSNPGRLVDYFNEEHLQNLKKLSDC